MTKNNAIDIVNSVLKDWFDYVPLYYTIGIVDKLIEKGVIEINKEKED